MGLFDLAGDFLKNLFTPGKSRSETIESVGITEPQAGIVDNATAPQAYQRMFNSGADVTGAVGTPEVIPGGTGGARIITDPRQSGRFTAQGKDLGYTPINIEQSQPSEFDQQLYLQLMQQMGQPITNADYYPDINNINKGNVSVGDMSAPVYAGSFGLPPMGAIDKLQTRNYIKSAIDRMDEERGQGETQVGFIPPEIRQVAVMPRVGAEFEKEANQYVSKMEAKYGSNWRKMANQDPETWSLVNKWKGIESAFNTGYDKASEYLKLYQENQKSGNKGFFPEEAVRAAKWLATGVNETAEGLPIDVNEVGKLMNQFEVYSNFDTWANDAVKNNQIRSTILASVPQAVEIKLAKDATGMTDPAYIEHKKTYGEFPGGYHAFLIEKEANAISEETAKALIDKWDSSNPGSWQQMKKSKSESKDSVLKRLYSEFQNYLGTEIKTEVMKTSPPPNTNINVNTGKPTKKTFYQSIDERKGEIMEQAMNIAPSNVPQAKQLAEQIYGGGTADDVIFGVRAFDWPSIDMSITSMPYSELYEPSASDFDTRQEVFFGKVNKRNAGIPSENTTAKNLKVQGVINGFISKGKDGRIRVYSNEDAVKSPLTADYKPYLIQVVTDEKFETSGSNFDPNDVGATIEDMQISKKSPATSGIYYRFIPLDKSTATTLDQKAEGPQFTGGTEVTSVTDGVVEDF